MSWQPEIDELRRREELARRMGGPDKIKRQHDGGKLTVRERIERAARSRLVPRDRRASPARPNTTPSGELSRLHAVQLRDGPRPHRRPPRRGRRRRLHGARRRGRRVDLAEAGDVRADGGRAAASRSCAWSTAPAAAARSRRSRRSGYTYVPRNPGVGTWVVDNLATVPVVALGLGLGRRPRRGAAGDVSHYSLMVEGHLADVRRRPAGRGARSARTSPRKSSAAAEIHASATARSTTRSTSEDEAFARARRFLSYLPSSVDELPRAHAPATTIPTAATPWLIDAIPRDRRKVYRHAADRRGLRRSRTRSSRSASKWGRSVVTGLARLDGWPVAVLASDPYRLRRRLDRRRLAQGHRASSTSPRPSTCRSCISSTSRAS